MAEETALPRSPSASSDTTIMSNINVALSDSASSAEDERFPSPTPATSVTDGSAADAGSIKCPSSTPLDLSNKSRRSIRSRSSVGSYNLAKLSGAPQGKRVASMKSKTRSFSGDTLVNESILDSDGSPQRRRRHLADAVEDAEQMDWQLSKLASPTALKLEPELPARVKKGKITRIEKIVNAAGKLKSALGKRTREAEDAIKSSGRQMLHRHSSRASQIQDAQDDTSAPPAKRARLLDSIVEMTSALTRTAPVKKQTKTWLQQGLYCGQHSGITGKLMDKNSASKHEAKERRHMPYPMFSAGTREADFRLPFDMFAPLKRKENPKEWKKLSKNSFTPSAKEVWRSKKMERSMCLCTPPAPDSNEEGCDESCLNRHMLYECDENNCALGPGLCTNRAFADLARRTKNGNIFDIGVEIIKTKECGYGLRANRSFAPGQIIIEYCGEVITQEESDRRMNEIYKDAHAYYLMEFDQGMIIDATKGNITRFVNHSCQPNCSMEKRIIKGEPRMALFAGPKGVTTGQELSYDYNFDNFSALNVLDCRCGAELCRGKLERRDAKKEKENLAASLKRKLLEQAAPVLEPIEKTTLKKRKTARWSKGWSYIDPEMEAMRLKEDAIESGKAIDGRALGKLKETVIKEELEAPQQGSRRGRAASLAAKAKLVERANSVRSTLSRRKITTDAPKEKSERRRSLLSRATSLLRSNSATTLESIDVAVETEGFLVESKRERVSLEDSDSVVTVPSNKSENKANKAKVLRQSTLSFQAVVEEEQSVTPPLDMAEDEDVLEMVLGRRSSSRVAA